ncbi:NADH-ubiquinone oxidoreductase [Spathaspora passalidarum NRRL Y-27907]|uniref:NADH-ubiquinone oxidoreductase n=1 Tax=Spathaspora passalidarum (strain NRRL Y-27907 / 11-Y1) TaxID=619300 RepID=G3AK46_SPAPN|nr:NADH-ubiquinone oxidoreductase [Spathaspora passalidarum NRRL Y-27907]EGW32857.1 NADH-ubiquinone oxidoreductase [Spathaspora passalidarum NRRL Y-27907]
MLRITRTSRSFLRFNSTTSVTKPAGAKLTKTELQSNEFAKQAPNRDTTWSATQESRSEIISKYPFRFIQKDLEQQPRPYAAIDLIAKEPVRYLGHGENIAVCDGNKGSTLQGHPKVFINLDQPKPATCGYCGLRYAKEEFKDLIEAQEKA